MQISSQQKYNNEYYRIRMFIVNNLYLKRFSIRSIDLATGY